MAVEVIPALKLKSKVWSAQLHGALKFQNRRVSQVSGYMSINAMWDQMLHEYDLSTIMLLREDWQYMQTIHRLTGGGQKGFLIEDPVDFKSTNTSVDSSTSGVVVGLTTTTFQLYKRYTETASSLYADRKITRPNATGFALYISGVLQTTGYTLNANTGIVTITSTPAPAASAVTWVGRFYVPVHFQSDAINWTLEAAGPEEARFYSGPNVVLSEIRE